MHTEETSSTFTHYTLTLLPTLQLLSANAWCIHSSHLILSKTTIAFALYSTTCRGPFSLSYRKSLEAEKCLHFLYSSPLLFADVNKLKIYLNGSWNKRRRLSQREISGNCIHFNFTGQLQEDKWKNICFASSNYIFMYTCSTNYM